MTILYACEPDPSQPTVTCSKLTIKTPEQSVQYGWVAQPE